MGIRMFCGELDGELEPSHIGVRAGSVRQSISALFRERDGAKLDNRPKSMWLRARKYGWRIVPVHVERMNTNRGIKKWLEAADAADHKM